MADQDTPESPSQLTAEQVAQIVNAAVTSHIKRLDLPKTIADAVAKAAPVAATPVQAPTETEDAPSKKGGKVDPNYAALQQKLELMEKRANDAEAARKAAESKSRDDRAYNELRNALTGKIRPDVLESVTRLLHVGDKRVEIDESGNVLFRARRQPAPGLPEEDTLLPLQDGVDTYLKSKEAAAFIPAPTATTTANTQARASRMPQTSAPKGAVPKYDTEAKSDEEMARRAYEVEQTMQGKF